MPKHSVVKGYNLSVDELEKYLDAGYEIKFVIPCVHSCYNATQFESRIFYVLVKAEE